MPLTWALSSSLHSWRRGRAGPSSTHRTTAFDNWGSYVMTKSNTRWLVAGIGCYIAECGAGVRRPTSHSTVITGPGRGCSARLTVRSECWWKASTFDLRKRLSCTCPVFLDVGLGAAVSG